MIRNRLTNLKKEDIIAQTIKYIWILPYMGGLLIVVALFSPIITISRDQYIYVRIWLFGLKLDNSRILELPESMVIMSLVFTLLLSLSILSLIIPSINFAFNKKKLNVYCNYWLFGGLIIIMGIIFYLILNYTTIIYNIVNHLRSYSLFSVEITPTIFLYFLSAFLGISGYVLSGYIKTHIN